MTTLFPWRLRCKRDFVAMTDRELRILIRFGHSSDAIQAAEEVRRRKVAGMKPDDFARYPRRFLS